MKSTIALCLLAGAVCTVRAQTTPPAKTSSADSLLNAMSTTADNEPVIATFKASRLIFSQTTETVKKGNLNFVVIHRFGDIGGSAGGGKTLWGLDNSSDIFIGFEYGISDKLDLQFGRSKFEQLLELGLKYHFLQQTADDAMPFSATIIGKTGLKPYSVTTNVFKPYTNRLNYFTQLVIARKFSTNFSMQITPSYLRNNLPFPYLPDNEKNFFVLGGAFRLKVTKRSGIVVDYHHPFSSFRSSNNTTTNFYDPIGVGWEIETGGHVFTLNLSNSQAISEINYLADTESSWGKGQFRLGFTISRMFELSGRSKNKY
ncbi:DUF5777 family beta-barrel protein [Mucilaginibacter myungsuensis]|uniref:DUF5777 domain-containing protein n=1 Tax=Mucilaginibacter myungsuensis TaxID=649104 RepID=A0A929KV94_9SPHI|nr:DUF5777 family beta-barrel protein [Mucilaginibacter myungsuensis]MBE9662229.1 hypothetical protein [Mucilaginibacter myungsuensis]MDN3599335.1 DUF5777 family beta-barrel protein [Mucilaginibacter myungsuensis]